MKKAAPVFALLIFALSLAAQVPAGLVQGRAVDKEGKPLAGIRVTLARPLAADQKVVTGPSGIFRFPALRPGPDYSVKAEHPDFKTTTRTGIVVPSGGRVAIDLPLEPGKPEEAVSVTTPSPMIDRTGFASGASFGWTELQTLPTARDPWVIIQLVPGVMIDRENVGGSESGEQSHFVARGDSSNGADAVWTVDGIDVTDRIDLGLSRVNYDFDAIDTIAVTTGGAADVTQQTSGVAVNILTRRAGNRFAGAARFYLTDRAFQSDNLTGALRSQGVTDTNRIQQIKDFGASAGGPLIKNRLWFWGAYGAQDLFTYTIFDQQDRTQFADYSFKLNAEIFKGNRAEVLFMTSSKERFGAGADFAKPEGNHQTGRFALGSPIFKFQDEQTMGSSLLLAAKLTWTNTGTNSRPMIDEGMTNPVVFDIAEGLYVPFSTGFGRSWDYLRDIRAGKDLEIAATLFRDDFLGLSHEIKAGLDLSDRKVTRASGFPQNYEVFRDFTAPLIDLGAGLVVPPAAWQRFVLNREDRRVDLLSQSTAFLQDTIVKGRFALQLGLRYDYQKPSTGATPISTVLSTWSNIFTSDALTSLNTVFPPLTVNAVSARYQWSTWSPRVALSWDLKGDGRTVLKLSLAQYGDLLAAGANTPTPLGLTGNLNFWWNDGDADALVDRTEIYWMHAATNATAPNQLYALFDTTGILTSAAAAAVVGGFESDAYLAGNFSGFDWAHPDAVNYDYLTTFYRSDVDANVKNVKTSPRTREVSLTLEREIRSDLAASIGATFRRYDNFDLSKAFYPADIFPSTPDLVIDNTTGPWYAAAGTVPQTITYTVDTTEKTIDLGQAGGRTWYLPVATFPGPTPYRMIDKTSAFRTYFGLDLGVTKRLSHRWFMNASVTLQANRLHLGDSSIDPTNDWALDGQSYPNWSGLAGGKVPMEMASRWLAKVSALYQLPWGFGISGTFLAREGWSVPHYITLAFANPGSWPGLYRSNIVYLEPPTKDRLPTLSNLTLRLEKQFKLGTGRMFLMADVFNAMNTAVINRVYDANFGTYYVDTAVYVANPFNRAANEILNPRVWRLGVRFEF